VDKADETGRKLELMAPLRSIPAAEGVRAKNFIDQRRTDQQEIKDTAGGTEAQNGRKEISAITRHRRNLFQNSLWFQVVHL
jgi:hypothetical protein